jgi:hypothetical protein
MMDTSAIPSLDATHDATYDATYDATNNATDNATDDAYPAALSQSGRGGSPVRMSNSATRLKLSRTGYEVIIGIDFGQEIFGIQVFVSSL